MVSVSYISDLHTELQSLPPGIEKLEGANVCILAGDITSAGKIRRRRNDADARGAKRRLEKLFNTVQDRFDLVLYVMGNHEFYDSDLETAQDSIEEFISDQNYTRIKVLSNSSVYYENIKFVGTTLWTDYNNRDPMAMLRAQSGMSDFRWIENRKQEPLLPDDIVDEFRAGLRFLLENAAPDVPTVVITHHAPSRLAEKGRMSDLSAAFVNDLDPWFPVEDYGNILAWVHGHTHTNYEYIMGHIPVFNNMYGYLGYEKTWQTFDMQKRFTIGSDMGVVAS